MKPATRRLIEELSAQLEEAENKPVILQTHTHPENPNNRIAYGPKGVIEGKQKQVHKKLKKAFKVQKKQPFITINIHLSGTDPLKEKKRQKRLKEIQEYAKALNKKPTQ